MQERCLDREAKASTELGGGELIRQLEGLQGAGSYTHLPALPPPGLAQRGNFRLVRGVDGGRQLTPTSK